MTDHYYRWIPLTVLLSLNSWSLTVGDEDLPRDFSHPDRIRYDGQCLTIEGKDSFIYSGAFHYFRCPKPLWRDRFAKIREAGFNAVETYVAWNWHEPDMPGELKDFSKVNLDDLRDWLKMAHEEFGLYTIVRPGPYICAEWAGGGFPRWLERKRPAAATESPWLRSDEPVFLDWERHWFRAVCPVIASEQITRKPAGRPGVILFQIENEYDYCGGLSDARRATHLKALCEAAHDAGIDVPIFTCWTKQVRGSQDTDLRHVFDAVNLYPRWSVEDALHNVEKAKKEQPDAPGMVAELQGGWFSSVGGALSEDQEGLSAAQINAVTLMSILGGATILNYYMLFGGTNFGDWAALNITTTYDYYAPIREPGGVGEKYLAVKAIAGMLRQYGPSLARSERIACEVAGGGKNLFLGARRDREGRVFLFCWNRSRTDLERGSARVKLESGPEIAFEYDLAPFGFRVLWVPRGETDGSKGTWLPKAASGPERPEKIPAAVRPSITMRAVAPGATDWTAVQEDDTLSSCGIYDSRYVTYRARPVLTEEQIRRCPTLDVELFSPGGVVVRANSETRFPESDAAEFTRIPLSGVLKAGENLVEVLVENRGHANGGPMMESPCGLRHGRLVPAAGPGGMITDWRAREIDSGDGMAESAPEYDDSGWAKCPLTPEAIAELSGAAPIGTRGPRFPATRLLFGKKDATAVYRAAIELTDDQLRAGKVFLRFERIDDEGTVYVNGRVLGHSTTWTKPFVGEATALLKPGRNTLAVVVKNSGGGPGGVVREVRLYDDRSANAVALSWELGRQLTGVAARWWESKEPQKDWRPIKLDTRRALERKASAAAPPSKPASDAKVPAKTKSPAADEPLVAWYRVEFALPPPDSKMWVPWRAVLDASGNGMIYLNGEPLGRYWEVGPQREYYLPECWLRFDPEAKNVLTLCLRSTENGAAELRAVEVSPYVEFAERR